MAVNLPEPPPSAVEAGGHHARMGDRSLFPELRPRVYLNHAAISPPSLPVRQAVLGALSRSETLGVGAIGGDLAQRERLRERFAVLAGCAAADVAILGNTSQGVSAIAQSFPWVYGDEVVVFQGEFPANVTPWQRAAQENDLKLTFLSLEPYRSAPDQALETLETALRGGVKLVAVSAVQFQTGLRMPVGSMARLCHDHGAQIFVDGIQACGASPLDVHGTEVDYLATGGHKWLMGPTGVGFLYVSPSRVQDLRPVAAGWMSHEDGMGFLFDGPGHMRYDRAIRKRTDLFESGMPNVLGCAAAEAALELIQQLGVQAIWDHVQRYIDALEEGLLSRGFQSLRASTDGGRSTLLCTRPPEGLDVVELHQRLVAEGVDCSIPDGLLRFAPHWPNHLDEVPQVLAAVDRVAG